MDWVACVGMDWGDKEHAYAIQTPDGLKWTGAVGSSAEEVHEWARALRQRFPTGTIVVAMEQGRGSLLYALMMYEFFALVPINPRASKAYRESRRLSHVSNDALDAALILDFALKHLSELRVWRADDALTRKMRLLVENRRTLVDQRTALTHALASTLKQYFPQALQWFGGECSAVLRAVLARWPTLHQLLQASVDEITAVMRACRRRKPATAAQKLVAAMSRAVPMTSDSAIVDTSSMYAQALVSIVATLETQIATYDQAIAALWSDHPDRTIFDSLPGAGPVLAPRLAVAFGVDRNRFDRACDVQCYSGIAPVIEQSGQQRWVHARRGYPKFIHQTFHEFAQASLPHCAWAKAFYQQQRDRGARRHEAIRALAFRWIRIVLRLWKTGEAYDEQRYLEVLEAKHSPLVARLVA